MDHSCLWIFHLAFVIFYTPVCNGIQCYFCSSITDSRCQSAYFSYQSESDQPIDCTQNLVDNTLTRIKHDLLTPADEFGNFDCLKAEVKVSFNKTAIVRGCAQAQNRRFDPCADLRRQFTNPSDLYHCSVCKTDSCNRSHYVSALDLSILLGTVWMILRYQ